MLAIVSEQGFSSTAELMLALGVSDMTVRRDAQLLADDGRVRIVHGGVSVLPAADLRGNGEFEERAAHMAAAKRAIGREAASRIFAGQIVAIDAGTTAREVARAIVSEDLTIVTHSAPVIADQMGRARISLVALGGHLHHETLSFEGQQVLSAIGDLQVDTLLLAASGLSARGVYCANDFDAVTKRALISIASRVVLVADSSKFRTSAMVRVCSLEEIDEIIVDDGIRDDDRASLVRAGVEIRLVPSK
jgi:DeoR/GlpR family transcriptional regulator of sugar metabolism